MKNKKYARTADGITEMKRLELWGNEHTAIKTSNNVQDLCDGFEVVTDIESYEFDNFDEAVSVYNRAMDMGCTPYLNGYIIVNGERMNVANYFCDKLAI